MMRQPFLGWRIVWAFLFIAFIAWSCALFVKEGGSIGIDDSTIGRHNPQAFLM
jgi:hypothetical protein